MEEQQTPTFAKETVNKSKIRYHFSDMCVISKSKKKNNLFKDSGISSEKRKNKKSKSKKGHSPKKSKFHKSCKLNISKFKDIEEKSDDKNLNNNNNNKDNVNNFIRNHKFTLRDDFNEKNANKFLSSKEIAFEIPIILTKEIILEY